LNETVAGLSKREEALNTSLSSLQKALNQVDKSVTAVKSSKADRKTIDNTLKDIDKKLSPLSKEVKKVVADTAVISAELSAGLTEMETVAKKVSDDFKALNLVIDALQADKASKKELLAEIDHIENVLKTSGNQNEKQAADFATSIRRLELRIRSLEEKSGISPPSSNQLTDSTPAASATDDQRSDTQSPAPLPSGDLTEQDIIQ
jgi:chromosome segregation ATPase